MSGRKREREREKRKSDHKWNTVLYCRLKRNKLAGWHLFESHLTKCLGVSKGEGAAAGYSLLEISFRCEHRDLMTGFFAFFKFLYLLIWLDLSVNPWQYTVERVVALHLNYENVQLNSCCISI